MTSPFTRLTRFTRRSGLRAALALPLAATLGLPLATGTAHAEDAWPSRPIRLVVPYPPGGGTDTVARAMAAKLTEAWKVTVIVDNKPGASGIIGNDAVAKSPADGYTLLLGITALIQGATLFSKLPYDPVKDFKPITAIARSADLLLVPKDSPVNTVAELVAWAKANPGKTSIGNYGNGTSSHIHAAMFNGQAGLDISHVPYKGAAPLMTDLLGGQLTAAFVDATTAQPQMGSGKLKTLAVTGARPSPLAPNAPTFTNLGYKAFEPYGWFALFAPAATPPAIVKKLSDEAVRIVATPEMRERLLTLGLQPAGDPQPDFAREYQADLLTWSKVIKDAQIKLD